MREQLLTLCIDLEEFSLPQELGIFISQEDRCRISFQGAQLLFNLLESLNTKATFFSTENMAKAFPELLKSLVKKGYEVGLHGIIDNHKCDIISELERQKTFIESIIEMKIFGFRSHKFVYFPSYILRDAGFIYDNSLHPTYVPGRYCNIFSPCNAYMEEELIRIPVSVTPLFRLPFSWFWFRNLGLHYAKLCSQMVYFNQRYINIYFHSWDFANLTELSFKLRYKPFINNAGDKMLSMFTNYLDWHKRKHTIKITMFEYVNRLIKSKEIQPLYL